MQHLRAPHTAATAAPLLLIAPLQQVVLLVCAAAMFGPSIYRLMNAGAWSTPEFSHGPLILALSLWLVWRKMKTTAASASAPDANPVAWLILLPVIACYLAGVLLQLEFLETLSLVGVAAAVVMLIGGKALLLRLRFPIIFMLFMVPLPSPIAGGISNHMKPWAASIAVDIMSALHYPVGKDGSSIVIGQYQLLVADACAGMHNLMMLEALGILYLHLVRGAPLLRDVALATLIVPISFVANVLRVVFLALITFYGGEAMGEGYIHKFAGIIMFVIALAIVLGVDRFLRFITERNRGIA